MRKCLLPFFLLLVSCSIFGGKAGVSITIQNRMDASIYIYDFSPLQDAPEFPFEIKAGANYVFESDLGYLPEGYEFKVEINGILYKSDTGYVQDWSKFSIIFDGEENTPRCTIDRDGEPLNLKPVVESES
ncbi:MAG: hypothetical protein NC548_55600 [Lachnospiraceae bacterium]|nr:hypothetical protein [Lachnospiraceae bacterium]